MLQFLAAFVLSAALTLLVVRILRHRGAATKDHDLSGPQKVHTQPVARVGGLSVFATLVSIAAVAAVLDWQRPLALHLALLAICGLPAFAAGLAEDLTKRVPPFPRLVAAAISALLAVYLLDTAIRRTDIWGLDGIAAFEAGATLLAMIAVAGMANAVNIIDGFNGLASMCVVMILLAVAYVAGQTGDPLVLTLALIGAGATLGFFIWNYPHGLIFLGDGGAYFLGFYTAEVALLLVVRNDDVSPLFPLLAAVYPVFETLFSMYRRRVVRGRAIAMPDGVHLHSLVYRRLLRWAVGNRDAAAMTKRNAMTAPYLWMLCMTAVVPSVLFWNDSRILGLFILAFGLIYVSLYSLIIRFKSPRWLLMKGKEKGKEPPRR
jgi:UDP-N-acetylmuramyl pentapeptide phosphotransferase/UDP-N-acetylglucosamine-1-phosphate transferase